MPAPLERQALSEVLQRRPSPRPRARTPGCRDGAKSRGRRSARRRPGSSSGSRPRGSAPTPRRAPAGGLPACHLSVISSAAAVNCPPALLTSTSTAPKRSSVASTKARTWSGSRTSQGNAMHSAPSRSSCARTSASGSGRRPQIATLAPESAKATAVARPIPVPPPVIRATLPRFASGARTPLIRRARRARGPRRRPAAPPRRPPTPSRDRRPGRCRPGGRRRPARRSSARLRR